MYNEGSYTILSLEEIDMELERDWDVGRLVNTQHTKLNQIIRQIIHLYKGNTDRSCRCLLAHLSNTLTDISYYVNRLPKI